MPYFVISITLQYVYIVFVLPSIDVLQFSLKGEKIPIALRYSKTFRRLRLRPTTERKILRERALNLTHDNLCRSKADQLLASTK